MLIMLIMLLMLLMLIMLIMLIINLNKKTAVSNEKAVSMLQKLDKTYLALSWHS